MYKVTVYFVISNCFYQLHIHYAMAIRKRNHPDKEECLKILREIDSIIPNVYAKEVQEVMKKKGIEDIPTTRQITNVRNWRIYDLEVVKALREISQQKEEQKRKSQAPEIEFEKVGKN